MNKFRTGFFTICALAALAAVPHDVDAAVVNFVPGTICNPYNAGQANDIDYVTSGVRTTATSTRQVICALPRELGTGSGGGFASIGGTLTGAATMPLTLYSYLASGAFAGSASATGSAGSGGGQFSATPASLTPTQLPPTAFLSVLAELPASTNGVLQVIVLSS
jgi:hypothetical protein